MGEDAEVSFEDAREEGEAGGRREECDFKDPLAEDVDGDALQRHFQLEDEREREEEAR